MPSLVHTVYPGIEIEARLPSVTGWTQNKINNVYKTRKRVGEVFISIYTTKLPLTSFHFFPLLAAKGKPVIFFNLQYQGKLGGVNAAILD